jgi:hypothetical protein
LPRTPDFRKSDTPTTEEDKQTEHNEEHIKIRTTSGRRQRKKLPGPALDIEKRLM